MPQVSGPVVKARAARLRQRGEEALTQFYHSCIGQEVSFLVESTEKLDTGVVVRGKTDHFAPIHLETPGEFAIGSVMRVRIVDATSDGLKGQEIA
jgi:threonylcarbamoyladenosine tRNA methylthiotransferase MtaB